jgi:polar amino acid transport system substrate-binding protein
MARNKENLTAAFFAICGVALLVSQPASALELQLVTEQNPPFNMIEVGSHQVTGMSTDLIRTALESAKIPYQIALTGWNRAIETARVEPDTCVFSTNITNERKHAFKWIGPLYKTALVIMGKENHAVLENLDDLKNGIVGAYMGDVTTELLRARGINVDQSATSDILNINKLEAGRIDYWAIGRERYIYLKKVHNIRGLAELLKMADSELYLACNKAIRADAADKINQMIAELHRNGTAEAIRKKYE